VILAASTNEVDHLDLVAFLDHGGLERAAPQHLEVHFNGNATGIDLQLGEKRGDSQRAGKFVMVMR
jgi:hypothetical protein